MLADTGTTYNSSITFQHLVAHNPDVRPAPPAPTGAAPPVRGPPPPPPPRAREQAELAAAPGGQPHQVVRRELLQVVR
jgi:hypothetical protein